MKKEFDITFKIKNKRYKIRTFSPLWWTVKMLEVAFYIFGLWMLGALIFSLQEGGKHERKKEKITCQLLQKNTTVLELYALQ